MINATAEAASNAASKAMYGGAGTTVASWLSCRFELTGDDWTVIFGAVGAAVAVGGFLINWRYKRLHYRLALKRAQADPEA